MTRNERQLKAVQQEMKRHSDEAQAIWKKADEEDRETSHEERGDVERHIKSIDALKEQEADLQDTIRVEQDVRKVGQEIGTTEPVIGGGEKRERPRAKSLGEQFVDSKGYKDQLERGFRGDWSTGHVELKATLVEGENIDLGSGTPGAGAALVPMDQQVGIQPILFQPLTIADLLAQGTTNSSAVSYMRETTASAGSIGVVDEAAAKPEATLVFDRVTSPVLKVASWLPVSDEMLEDAAQLQAYINGRLSLFVRTEEENQILNGTGGSEINGLLNQVPVGNQGVVSGADTPNAADHIYAAITKVRTASFLEPDGIVIHPDDWAALRLVKDDNANYIGGTPFSNGLAQPGETLWGKRVVVTSAIGLGEALVGAFRTASQIYRRGGLTVEASNSHSDYFVKNLTAIRAEERFALAVYRPAAFATVDVGGVS